MTRSEALKPQVAILTKDLKRAAALGRIFKKLKIIPDTFDSTESFLIAHLESGYNFLLLDISMAFYEDLPLIRRSEMFNVEVSFTHNEFQLDQLAPTYGLDHLGYVNFALDLAPQVKGVLSKYNRKVKAVNELTTLREFRNENQPIRERFVATNESLKEKAYYRDSLFNLVKKVQLATNIEESFEEVLSCCFNEINFIKGVSLFEMNEDVTKLLPISLNTDKNIDSPALWLGHGSVTEVEELVVSVAQNILGPLVLSPIISFPLSMDGEGTSGLLVLEVKKEFLFKLDWEVLEITLLGVYAQSVRKSIPKIETRVINRTPFDLLAKLTYSSEKKNLISIDLSDIFDFLQIKKEVEFDWALFSRDFNFMLSQIAKPQDIYNASLDTIAFTVENRVFDESYLATKELCSRFSVSKYFSGVSKLDIQGLKFHVREVPFSEFGLINHLEQKNEQRTAVSFSETRA